MPRKFWNVWIEISWTDRAKCANGDQLDRSCEMCEWRSVGPIVRNVWMEISWTDCAKCVNGDQLDRLCGMCEWRSVGPIVWNVWMEISWTDRAKCVNGDQLDRLCEMCEWRSVGPIVRNVWMEISWTDRAKTEVLHRLKGEKKILHTIKIWKANCIDHIVRRNCRSKHVIEGNTEGTGRRRQRCKQLLNKLKTKRSCWNMKEESLDRTLWRTRFGRGYGPVKRQSAKLIRYSICREYALIRNNKRQWKPVNFKLLAIRTHIRLRTGSCKYGTHKLRNFN